METQAIPFLRTRLSLQMFLQFAVWGAWAPVLGKHLENMGFSPQQIGAVYGTGALATMISPLIAGQIADRWFSTQVFLSFAYFVSGGLCLLAAQIQSAAEFDKMWWLSFGSMLMFGPTLGLANSLCFHHLQDAKRDFPLIRLWGTIGWIASSWILAWCMDLFKADLRACLFLAGFISIGNGAYCLFLPKTPPSRDTQEKFAVGKVLAMLRDPSFALFSISAFVLMLFASFYYSCTAVFLPKVGIEDKWLSAWMSVGQATEILTMFPLPLVLRRLGFKLTIAIGIAAWALRFAMFAFGTTKGVAIAAQALHGVSFAFAIAAAMIYVERICAPDVRGSMQSFLSFLTYGLGMFVGFTVAGRVSTHYQHIDGADWQSIWLVPTYGCIAVLALFAIGFRERKETGSAPPDEGERTPKEATASAANR